MRRLAALLSLLALFALLSGCATRAPVPPVSAPAPAPGRDGPEANPPPNLLTVPDAVPKVELLRQGGPNKPYEIDGVLYQPFLEDKPFVQRGLASWYGKKFHGRPTANGEVYNMYAMTAAHATMPLPSYARVRNPANGREVVVRINDRGPFHPGRVIDLSYTAALKLDLLRGVAPVEVERLTAEAIRSGAWKRDSQEPPPVYVAQESAGAPQRETLNPAAGNFWLQLGSYRLLDGAEAMRSLLAGDQPALAPLLTVIRENGLHRLMAGPYGSRLEAADAAERFKPLMTETPLLVERR
ncbi:septal ring lytic transglycosylase RlpA family protein [Pelomonas sp. SE-A7]|uniref:septal ring lytic transglycosylase RlpA family protein n=1 Tax=Pelomonas sp. SE-A7 TaxID=3054953 RepID=UPI00259CDD10|nr:septal ring lytic transglycosylase RlpA family protein [Pelomonas sp. SE-A7]MDM4768352.1 septal ring lytic transglycosylase RlpA family protein [Pelomonas sp. SE-A7]